MKETLIKNSKSYERFSNRFSFDAPTKPRIKFDQNGTLVYPIALRQSTPDFLKIDMLASSVPL